MNIFVRKVICKAFITCTSVHKLDITVTITANSPTQDGIMKSKRFSKKVHRKQQEYTVNTV